MLKVLHHTGRPHSKQISEFNANSWHTGRVSLFQLQESVKMHFSHYQPFMLVSFCELFESGIFS